MIIEAKEEHQRISDNHQIQCSNVPEEFDQFVCFYHKQPCYKKFTRILQTEKPSLTQGKKRKLRSSKSKLVEGLPPKKRPCYSNVSFSTSKRLRLSTRISISVHNTDNSPISRPRNRFVYGNSCVICGKYIIKIKGQKYFPHPVTILEAAEKIKESARVKERYQRLYEDIIDKDLIASEFKCHHKCRTDLIRIEYPANVDKDIRVNNFSSLIKYINDRVLDSNQVLSMDKACEIYFGDEFRSNENSDTKRKRRSRLKEKLLAHYSSQIFIISPNSKLPSAIINSKNFDGKTVLNANINETVKNAANILRDSIVKYIEKTDIGNINWPPSVSDLQFEPLELLNSFLTTLLKSEKHKIGDQKSRLVESFSSDIVHALSKGEIITPKHYLLGMAFHSLTGKKHVIQILHRLGHSLSYDSILDIEAAHAQVQKLQNDSENTLLPLVPKSKDSVVTVYWVDNLDKSIDSERGGGMVNMTTMMAFQEKSPGAQVSKNRIEIEKVRHRVIPMDDSKEDVPFNPRKEPPTLPFKNDQCLEDTTKEVECFIKNYYQWLELRCSNSMSQIYGSFASFLLTIRLKQNKELQKTVEQYLPPLTTKVTEGKTIYSYMLYLQELSAKVNMKYTCITLDVGAAINAYKVLWSYPNVFGNIFIQLGDFHFSKEVFKVLGIFVKGSGFEDVVFQSELCTSGSLNGVLSGSHYNRAWIIHNAVSEAMERVLFSRFKQELTREQISDDDKDDISNDFEKYKKSVRDGKLGKTATFWLLYIDIMKYQHMLHTSVQENNFCLRLHAYKQILPLFIYYNLHNYSRYGSFYIEVLDHIESIYPGLRQTFEKVGISVQAQSHYPLRTAIDQRGEQTINRDAKTSGGIGNFASSPSSVMKWCLNRSESAKAVGELRVMAGLSQESSINKDLRPARVLKSESNVCRVINVLENEYTNPFGNFNECGEKKLINISSGIALNDTTAKNMLEVFTKGKELCTKFRTERLLSVAVPFHDAIKKNKYATFKKSDVTVKSTTGKTKVVEVNRGILSALNAFSLKTGQLVDYENALKYPLSPVPLSIANPDGSRRVTVKSKLKDILLDGVASTEIVSKDVLIVDTMAAVNLITSVPTTYNNFAKAFVNILPKSYRQVTIVTNNYGIAADSIKRAERIQRGESDEIHIASLHSKTTPDFRQRILHNSRNKKRLVELIFEYIRMNKHICFNILQCQKIILNSENDCIQLTAENEENIAEMKTTQEEADTKLILFANYFLQETTENAIIFSPSGDTDVVVLSISLLKDFKDRVYIIDGHGKNKKIIHLNDIEIEESIVDSLIGFHSFTGNDFVSSFFGKGKKKCYSLLEKNLKFRQAFTELGNNFEISQDLLKAIQQYVASLYSSKKKDVNEARYDLFHKKFQNASKIVDISMLPPCLEVLQLHLQRSIYVAQLWKLSKTFYPELRSMESFGWNRDGTIKWVNSIYPQEIQDIFFHQRYNPSEELQEEDGHSDDEV